MDRRVAERAELVNRYGEPATPAELAWLVIKNADAWLEKEGSRVVGFAWNISFSDRVYCSHDAPIGERTNWGGHIEGAPTYFPGWTGRVWIRTSKEVSGWMSQRLNRSFVYAGSGGAGGYQGPWDRLEAVGYMRKWQRMPEGMAKPILYSWDFHLFCSDWPVMNEFAEKAKIVAALTNTSIITPRDYFEWNDPEVAGLDVQYLHRTLHGEVPE